MKEDMEMKIHMIPLNSVRGIIELHCPYHISNEATIELRDLLEEVGLEIAREAVKKFENLNKCREEQGLPRLKRLNSWAVKNSNYNKEFINGLKNKNRGLQPEEIVIPQGGDMSAQTITAKARQRTTDDQVEVV
ncbi:MAG: hypothetical protein U9O96_00295 [Candidatus Thermoplasmatota archaeon]|nr:hypothetical protein [Candidatus Thermoplasmatota archaeon]